MSGPAASYRRLLPARSTVQRPAFARAACAAVAGALVALAFAPASWGYLAIVGIAGITWAQYRAPLWTGAWTGAVFGLCSFGLVLPWMRIVGWDAYIGLVLFCAAWMSLQGIAISLVTRLPAWPVWVGCIWVLQEWLRDHIPLGGFPWGRIAFSQSQTVLAFSSRIAGAPGLSFVVALIGASLAAIFLGAYALSVRTVQVWTVVAVVVAIGAWAVHWYVPKHGASAVIAVIQGGTPQLGMGAMDVSRAVLNNHLAQTHALARQVRAGKQPQPQLVIWPENASDVDPFRDGTAYAQISAAARDVGAPILVGAVVNVPGNPDGLWNMGVVWNPTSGPSQRYIKTHPVPFGEYVPFRSILTRYIPQFERIPRDFIAGSRPGLLLAGGVRIGDIICFEVGYDQIINALTSGGAQLLVVQTNNATYGNTAQPDQQLAIEQLRAIETASPVAVAATTGVSAVIRPDGSFAARIDQGHVGSHVSRIWLADQESLSSRLGSMPELLGSAVGMVAIISAALQVALAARRRDLRRLTQ